MSAAARASQKWIMFGAGAAISGVGYLLFYGPGQKAVFEAKKPTSSVQAASAPDALDPNAFRAFKLSNITKHNHNTNTFSFAFDDPKAKYNGTTASCVVFKANINGKEVIRPYTPVSRPNTIGQLEFVIKDYPNGMMSRYVHQLKKGDKLEIKGPIPKYPYEPNKFQKIVLIAGGTGITPMIQMIEEIILNPDDKTKIVLLYANTSMDDILLKKDLDKIAQKNPERLKVHYTVSKLADQKETDAWKGEVGHITADMLKKLIPMPTKKDDESLLAMVCGPPGFMKLISGDKTKDYKQGEVTGLLKALGFTEKNVFKF